MDISQALKTLECNPAWVDRYTEFLAGTIEPEKGGEAHHILPRALFPEFRRLREHPWNRIVLHPADHLFAHYLLYRAIPSTRTRFAFRMMVGTRNMALIEQNFDESVVRAVAETYAEAQASMHHTLATRVKMSASQIKEHQRRRSAERPYSFMPRGDSHHRRIFGISDETKAKISAGLTGRTQPASQVETRRLKLIGQRKPWSQEARDRRSASMSGAAPLNGLSFAGHKHTKASLDKKSEAMKALHRSNPNHPCFTNKPSGADHWTFGKERSASTKKKISESLTGKQASQATRDRMSATHQRKMFDAIPAEEHETFEHSLTLTTEEDCILQRRGFKTNSRPYMILTGLMHLRLGTATEANRRAWQQAATWVRLSRQVIPKLTPRKR